jgi:hypothetical protein
MTEIMIGNLLISFLESGCQSLLVFVCRTVQWIAVRFSPLHGHPFFVFNKD